MTTGSPLAPIAPRSRPTAIEAVCTLIRQQIGQETISQLELQRIANAFSCAFQLPAPQVNGGGDIATPASAVEPTPRTTPRLELSQSDGMLASMLNEIHGTHLGDVARTQLTVLTSELRFHVRQSGR